MFMGEYSHTIDEKGRLIIPARFREGLGNEFVVTRGMDGCLFAYPLDSWNEFEEKLKALPGTGNKDARKLIRFFTAKAAGVELDKQGRILIPAPLREHAGLQKDVILTGVLDRVEIWDPDKWNSYSDYEDLDDIAEELSELGFNI